MKHENERCKQTDAALVAITTYYHLYIHLVLLHIDSIKLIGIYLGGCTKYISNCQKHEKNTQVTPEQESTPELAQSTHRTKCTDNILIKPES